MRQYDPVVVIMADTCEVKASAPSPNDEHVSKKKEKLTNRLQKRDEERLADLQKRKEDRESATVVHETADFFSEHFTKSRTAIEAKLESIHEVDKAQLTDQFDSLLISVQELQRFLTDSTMFLTAYDVQRSQEVISKLQTSIQEKRDELVPKKKFAFKSKKKTSGAETPVPVPIVKEEVKKELSVEMTDCCFADETGKKLTKRSSEVNQKDVALSRLKDCDVFLEGSPGAVHISNLNNCKVFSGPVSGSVFIDACLKCIFVLPCQQLRIHSTSEASFYIHVTSKAIIEDCKNVLFAPYNLEYADLDSHYKLSGLDKTRNNWNDVDDFNWLASDMPSPHWKVLPENDRVLEWDLLAFA